MEPILKADLRWLHAKAARNPAVGERASGDACVRCFSRSRWFDRFLALRALLLPIFWTTGALLQASFLVADEPLHERIDRLVSARTPNYENLAAPLASDEEFLRRVTLDLGGTLPTSDQTRTFLADDHPDKRSVCVDRLLASSDYARQMMHHLDVTLMLRLPQLSIPVPDWEKFLRNAVVENRGWDQVTRDILSCDGSDPDNRGPARFYLARKGDVDQITRDIGRIFLGTDLECAQCHDHPEIDEYRQQDYHGLAAFLVRSFVFTDEKKNAIFAEKAEGEVSFESVFAVRDNMSDGPQSIEPRLFDEFTMTEPDLPEEEAYQVKPADKVRPIPTFSRRAQLPQAIANGSNHRFARTAANRFWALMFGRGLIHPVDGDHSGNPPSHPELLNLLAEQFAAHQFDIKWFLRQLALSKTYQRSSVSLAAGEQAGETSDEMFARAILKPLSPTQLARSLFQATDTIAAERTVLGDGFTEEALEKKLIALERLFVRRFGGLPGEGPQDFEATVAQALFLSNNAEIQRLTLPKEGNLAHRLLKLPSDDPNGLVDELSLSVLTRRPTAEEQTDFSEYLVGVPADERPSAIGELIWALIASNEFRFNH